MHRAQMRPQPRCMLDAPIAEMAQRAANEGVALIDYFSIVRGIIFQQLQLCASVNNANGVAILGGRLIEVLREIGRTTGELGQLATSLTINGNVVNIQNSPVLANLQANILTALRPFPEAKSAVIAALKANGAAKENHAIKLPVFLAAELAVFFFDFQPALFDRVAHEAAFRMASDGLGATRASPCTLSPIRVGAIPVPPRTAPLTGACLLSTPPSEL